MADKAPNGSYRWLDAIGKLIPVVAIILPVAGVLFRLVAFEVAGNGVPPSVAAALPIADLAVAGLGALAATLASLLVSLPIVWFAVVRRHLFERGRADRRFFWVLGAVSIIGVIVFSLPEIKTLSQAVLTFSSALFTVALGVVLITTDGRPRLFALGAVFAFIALINVVVAGIVPNTAATTVGQIQFVVGARTADGTYTLLGSDDATTWLLSCVAGSRAIRVPSDSIALVTVSAFGARPTADVVGFVQRCP